MRLLATHGSKEGKEVLIIIIACFFTFALSPEDFFYLDVYVIKLGLFEPPQICTLQRAALEMQKQLNDLKRVQLCIHY